MRYIDESIAVKLKGNSAYNNVLIGVILGGSLGGGSLVQLIKEGARAPPLFSLSCYSYSAQISFILVLVCACNIRLDF